MRSNHQGSNSGARVFFALWPDADIQRALHGVAMDGQKQSGGRCMRMDTLHLTLLFLGMAERIQLPRLVASIGKVSGSPFDLEINQFSAWKHNRISYAAPKGTVPALEQLVSQLKQAANSVGILFDQRAFSPHITLLRRVEHPLAPYEISIPTWHVESFVLVESTTTGPEIPYRVIRSWNLVNGEGSR